MAKDPNEIAERYGLSADVAADFEDAEGPPSGAAQLGRTRTVTPEHSKHAGHGPKTRARTKQIINNGP
jgi:hypothetical protein